ncbi:BLUF domain-containing protein [Hankyongella ginsenosidimutans]|nr:BLUF domain-containing protein [Hankyongella ginsenosidimutans]
MPLARMICASQTKFPVGQANDKTIFRAIHDESARHYAERQITGALLFDWDNFLQILEGDRARLTDAFLFMARDPGSSALFCSISRGLTNASSAAGRCCCATTARKRRPCCCATAQPRTGSRRRCRPRLR